MEWMNVRFSRVSIINFKIVNDRNIIFCEDKNYIFLNLVYWE